MTCPQFTDDDIRRIEAWLPEEVDPSRRKLLPLILLEWARLDLRDHLRGESPAAKRRDRESRERLARLGTMTAGVLEMLDELDRGDWLTFAAQIGVASGQDYPAIFSQANEERLRQARDSIALIAAAGERPLMKLGPGQPRNILAYLVMMDIAAIFEYLVSSR